MGDVMVIGVGGCGINSIVRMRERIAGRARFAAMDADGDDLKNAGAARIIHLDPALFIEDDELSDRAEAAAFADDVASAISGADRVVVTGCLGGRTGSAFIPRAVKLAKISGACAIALVYMPFIFDGMERRRAAAESLARLRESADYIRVVENDDLLKLTGRNIHLEDAFVKADRAFCDLITAIKEAGDPIAHRAEIQKLFE